MNFNTTNRFDKLLKRLKPLFEEKLKMKQRLKGLQSFLEVSEELDEVKIFNENDEMIFEVFYDAFNHRISRIKERVCSISSKDATNLFELTDILTKILKYCHEKVNTGWRRADIFGILEMLSSRSNHVKVRICGLTLVQIILSHQSTPDSDLVRLYGSAVSLDVFKQPSEIVDPGLLDSIGMDENGILADFKRKLIDTPSLRWSATRPTDEPPVTDIDNLSQATPTVVIPREGNELSNNIEIFVEILNNFLELAGDIQKAGVFALPFDLYIDPRDIRNVNVVFESEHGVRLTRMWDLFKNSYLKLLFPFVCKAIGTESKNGDGFALCPLDLLNALVDFIAKMSAFPRLGDAPSFKEISNSIVTIMLAKNQANFEIVHEIIRQAFLSQHISVAAYCLGCWIISTHTQGHPFLKRLLVPKMTNSPTSILSGSPTGKSPPLLTINSNSESKSLPSLLESERVNDLLVNQMLRRYSKYYQLSIFNGKRKDQEMQVMLVKEALQFYRFLGCEKVHLLDQSSWSMIMNNLLELATVLYSFPEALDLANFLTETILITWIRSRVKSESVWSKLESVLSTITEIPGVASSWAKLIIQFTYIMSESTYGIGLIALKEENGRHKRGRARTRDNTSSSGNLLSLSTPEPLRKPAMLAPTNLNKKSIDEQSISSDFVRASQSSKSTTKASSVSEKNSSNDEIQIDSGSAIQILADSNSFAQMKDLKDSYSKDSLWVWKSLISCIGKIHNIKNPEIHFEVMDCFVTVWGVLEKIRIIQPFSQTEMPNLFEFAGIIFKSVIMEPQYSKSAALAAACLGKLMCRHQDFTVDSAWLHIYYTYIIKVFKGPVDNVSLALLSNSGRLYSLYLSGVTITIPATMQMLANVCTMKGTPEQAVRAAITMIGSLLVYEKHYQPLLPPPPERTSSSEDQLFTSIRYSPPISDEATLVFVDLKFGLFNLLQSTIHFHNENKNEDYCELLLWNLGILYLEESVVLSIKDEENLQNDILFLLLEYVSSKALPLVSAAADSLSVLAENFHRIRIHDETLIHIIDRLAWGISENLSIDEKLKRKDLTSITSICAILFKCLLDWLMVVPPSVVSNPNIALRISEVIDEAIHVATVGMDAIELEKEKSSDEEKESVATNKQEFTEIYKIYEHLREAAESTLYHLTHHLDNYPPPLGPATMNSTIPDPLTEDGSELYNCHYFSLNDSSLITLIEKPQGSFHFPTPTDTKLQSSKIENKVCILIRNMTGKYSWDMSQFYHDLEEEREESHKCIFDDAPRAPLKVSRPFREPTTTGLDLASSDSFEFSASKGLDPLETALLRIQSNHPECIYKVPSADSAPRADNQSVIQEYLVDEHSALESRTHLEPEKKPTISKLKSSAVEAARLFLSQTGQLSFDYLKMGKMVPLVKSPHLIRDIRGLDRKYSREVGKFAVLYVAPGQEDEGSILRNSAGSYQYDEFVASLGWQIRLDEHPGYSGGLDATMVTGGLAIYYCSSTVEMIFHDATRMPTDAADPKQIKKKRHIGNDHVHIVWNEHVRDYRWDTIGGDFANAQIVITPLANGLYAIDTYRDELVRPFGPLQSRSVVSKECLGSLIRCTAMNAYRNALCAGAPKGMEPHPFTTRKQAIELIQSRHKMQNDTFEKHMNVIISEFAEKRYATALLQKAKEEKERQALLSAIAAKKHTVDVADTEANVSHTEKEIKERSEPAI